MIGIENQYIFKFDIGGRKDFINTDDLIKFEVIEEAGNVLPVFSLDFETDDPFIIKFLHEGNDFNVSFGVTKTELVDMKLNILKFRTRKSGDDKRMVSLQGCMSKLAFVNTPKVQVTSKKSGVEVIIETAKKYFAKIDTNITTSIDSQNWVQYSIPDKMFMSEVWMHSWIPNSFVALGISMDGTFILKDILKLIKDYQSKSKEEQRYKYRFTTNIKNKNDFTYAGDYVVDTDFGFINYWTGYKKEKLLYNFENGDDITISEEIKPIMSLTNKLVRQIGIDKKYSEIGIINDNIHKNYWNAFLRNLSSLAIFSSVKVEFNFDSILNDIKILDLIMFQEPEITQNKSKSGEELSGYYLVSKVARTLTSGSFVTTVLACREAINSPKGNIK